MRVASYLIVGSFARRFRREFETFQIESSLWVVLIEFHTFIIEREKIVRCSVADERRLCAFDTWKNNYLYGKNFFPRFSFSFAGVVCAKIDPWLMRPFVRTKDSWLCTFYVSNFLRHVLDNLFSRSNACHCLQQRSTLWSERLYALVDNYNNYFEDSTFSESNTLCFVIKNFA